MDTVLAPRPWHFRFSQQAIPPGKQKTGQHVDGAHQMACHDLNELPLRIFLHGKALGSTGRLAEPTGQSG
jgi:hypothetical protein